MAVYLEEFVESIDNLPAEIKHFLAEIRSRDDAMHDMRKQIYQYEKQYNAIVNPKPTAGSEDTRALATGDPMLLMEQVNKAYETARDVTEEKIALSERAVELMNKHLKKLDDQIALAASNLDDNVFVSHLFESDSESVSRQKRQAGTYTSASSRKGHRKRPPSGMMSAGTDDDDGGFDDDGVEPVYCICQQVSYGEMIACDNADKCPYEWFHLDCVGLSEAPSDRWFCPICRKKQ